MRIVVSKLDRETVTEEAKVQQAKRVGKKRAVDLESLMPKQLQLNYKRLLTHREQPQQSSLHAKDGATHPIYTMQATIVVLLVLLTVVVCDVEVNTNSAPSFPGTLTSETTDITGNSKQINFTRLHRRQGHQCPSSRANRRRNNTIDG